MIKFEEGRMIISEECILRWIFDRTFGKNAILIECTTRLNKEETGLPVNIFLDDSHGYIYNHHEKRVIFQGDYKHNTNFSNLFFLTISKNDPQIIVRPFRKLKLPKKDIEAIKTFVKNNAELIDKLADEEISNFTFIKQMKSNY